MVWVDSRTSTATIPPATIPPAKKPPNSSRSDERGLPPPQTLLCLQAYVLVLRWKNFQPWEASFGLHGGTIRCQHYLAGCQAHGECLYVWGRVYSPKACHNAGCSVFTYSIRPGEPVIVRGLFIVERVWGGIPKISMMLDVQEVIMVTSKS